MNKISLSKLDTPIITDLITSRLADNKYYSQCHKRKAAKRNTLTLGNITNDLTRTSFSSLVNYISFISKTK